jgi:hypothetical protein
MTAKALLAACLMALSSEWAAAQSGMASLRVRCDGDSAGAAVSINGQFKGECPFDAMVPEGTLKIDARKPTRNEYERVFEQEVRVGAGIIKSIEVVLGREQLTAEGKRALAEQAEAKRREEEARQADLQRQAAEVERQRAARFERLRNAADGGDVEAMATLAEVLEVGQKDLPPDPAQALVWYRKAAEAGGAEAMFRLSERMAKNGDATGQDWLRKAAQAGHRGAQQRLDQLPRYCQATAVELGSFNNTVVWSPGFEDTQSDGSDKPVKAALERYAQQLRHLQPRTWDNIFNQPTMRCFPLPIGDAGNEVSCYLETPKIASRITLRCGSAVRYRDNLRTMEAEARKNAGSYSGGTVLFDWRGQ